MNSSNNQTLEDLKGRYEKLNEQRIRTQTELKHAEDNLSTLQAQAREVWGTDDIDTLEKKLQEMRASNEKKLADYQRHLDEIEANLKQIEHREGNDEASVS